MLERRLHSLQGNTQQSTTKYSMTAVGGGLLIASTIINVFLSYGGLRGALIFFSSADLCGVLSYAGLRDALTAPS